MKKSRKYLALAILIGTFLSFLGALSPVFNHLEQKVYDFQLHLHGSEPVTDKILLFEVEPADYPQLMAFLERVSSQVPQAVGLDMPAFVSQYKTALEQLAQRQPDLPVVLSSRFQYQEPDPQAAPSLYYLPPASLHSHFKIGFANYRDEPDGILRRLPLRQIYRTEPRAEGISTDSFVAQLYQVLHQQSPIQAGKETLYIHYLGPAGTLRSKPFSQFRLDKDVWRDRILIFAETWEGTGYRTPFQVPMKKLEVHGHALYSLLAGNAYRKVFLLNDILPILLAVATVFFVWPFLKWGLFISVLSLLALVSLYVVLILISLSHFHFWLQGVVPLCSVAMTWLAVTLRFYLTEGRQRKQLESTFSRHLPEKTVRRLLERDEASTLTQNERRIITVMFADITGFSKMGEKLPPDQVMRILNEYLTAMTEIIFANQGTLDKYIGDGIMAVYGNIGKNNPQEDAYRAVKTALEMQEEMERLQHKWMHEGLRPIQIRVGLNTGDALVGYVGHEKRKEVTVIGDAVNTAARLEQLNKQYQTKILISQTTYEYVSEWVEGRPIGDERLMGKSATIFVYEIKGWKSKQIV